MATFKNMAAQGDFIIMRVEDFPKEIEKVNPTEGKFTVAHSETGHNHVMDAEHTEVFQPRGVAEQDLFELFLDVKAPTDIVHLRSYDTHETLQVPAGKYRIRRQREHTPEGFRRAAD